MRNRITLCIALLAAALAFAATAFATTTNGKLESYKTGKVVVMDKHSGKVTYIVNGKTNCGFSTGQSGDQIKCSTLGASKYQGKPVRIQWTRNSAHKRVATLVAVDLSK